MDIDLLGGYKEQIQKTETRKVRERDENGKLVKNEKGKIQFKKKLDKNGKPLRKDGEFVYEVETEKINGKTVTKKYPVMDKEGNPVLETVTNKQKHAFFIIISDTDSTFNFIVSIFYTQLFNRLVTKADFEFNGRLPIHVRCLLDEFSNIGMIPEFEKKIATIRSREISASVVLQAQSQLKAIYKDNADTIIGNMDTTLFLGGAEKTTLKDIVEKLGKETIDMYNTSKTFGNSQSHGQSYQKLGKELMTMDELAVMPRSKCILMLQGVRPFFSEKYDITSHHLYKQLSDDNDDNIFTIEDYWLREEKRVIALEKRKYKNIERIQDATDEILGTVITTTEEQLKQMQEDKIIIKEDIVSNPHEAIYQELDRVMESSLGNNENARIVEEKDTLMVIWEIPESKDAEAELISMFSKYNTGVAA